VNHSCAHDSFETTQQCEEKNRGLKSRLEGLREKLAAYRMEMMEKLIVSISPFLIEGTNEAIARKMQRPIRT
jgi:hypothetical protein